MYYIIETKDQLDQLPKVERCFVDLISLSEESHPSFTSPCVLYYNDFSKGYILPLNHSEAFSLDLQIVLEFLSSIRTIYLVDAKWHSYFLNLSNIIDVYLTILDETNKLEDLSCYTPVHSDFYFKHNYIEDINKIIPISKHYEKSECMFEAVKPFIGLEQNLAWKNEFIAVYKWVEQQGIGIDEKLFDKYFEPNWKPRSIKNGKIYTSYNLFNVTSRPTNAFNGINFLAFNKENNSRTSFVPSNDRFVELDFDGYHPRLIAKMVGVHLSKDISIHTQLGQLYFGKDQLTNEEYQESKKITFRQLYNGVEHEYRNIELFSKVAALVDDLWNTIQYQGYINLPNGRQLKKGDFTPQKVFNYYIQCAETVNNVEKLVKLKDYLETKKSRVVLVVYDSILVDFSQEDGIETLEGIKQILEDDDFAVKAKIGSNYNF